MRDLMKDVVNRLYTFMRKVDDPHFQDWIARWSAVAGRWDDPELDASFLHGIEPSTPGDDLPRK